MLRDAKLRFEPLSPTARTLVVGVILVSGLVVAGLRGPAVRHDAFAKDAEKVIGTKELPADARPLTGVNMTYVPDDAVLMVAAPPAAIFRQPGMAEFALFLDGSSGALTPTPVSEIEQVTFVLPGLASGRITPDDTLTIYQMTRPNQFGRLSYLGPGAEKKEYHGKIYLSERGHGGFDPATKTGFRSTPAVLRLDDRTLVKATTEEAMQHYLDAKKGLPKFLDARQWAVFEPDHAVAAFDASSFGPLLPGPDGPADGVLISVFSPLWKNATWSAGGVRLAEKLQVRGIAVARSPEDAAKVTKTVEAVLTLAANMTGEARAAAKREKTTPKGGFNVWTLDALEPLLASVRTRNEGNAVRIEGSVDMDVVRRALPPLAEMRKSAAKSISENHLKQIALAMHMYHDTYRHLPPAVLYGPDGKTPYSWRVALLPFLVQKDLYDRYRFDEPWDGPNNRKLAETVVSVYQCPGEPANSPNACYFVLVGPHTVFENIKGRSDNTPGMGPMGMSGTSSSGGGAGAFLPITSTPREAVSFADIRNGTSNTLMIVEAKRNIPWSKPEDIPYDPKKPIPELGGFSDDGFHAAMCNGSVQLFPKSISEKTLRALITRDGGEPIDDCALLPTYAAAGRCGVIANPERRRSASRSGI